MLDGCFGLRSTDVKRVEQHPTRGGHIPHGRIERRLVGLRRRVKATDLADELQRRVVQLVVSGLAAGLPQTLDVSAHGGTLLRCVQPPNGSRLSCGRLTRRRNSNERQSVPARAQHSASLRAITARQLQALVRLHASLRVMRASRVGGRNPQSIDRERHDLVVSGSSVPVLAQRRPGRHS